MSDGKIVSGPGSSIDKMVELAQKAGKWGIAGMVILTLKGALVCAIHPTWDSATDALGTAGWSMTLIGVFANTKRGNDMTATIGAESSIARAAIATALPASVVPVVPESSDPAVNREIKKQMNGKMAEILAAQRRQNNP